MMENLKELKVDEETVIKMISEVVEKNPKLFNMVKKLNSYFVMEDGFLQLSETKKDIIEKEGLSDEQVVMLDALIDTQHKAVKNLEHEDRASVYKNYLCITYVDLTNFFGGVASVTLGGVVALLTAVGSIWPGVGNVAGAVVGLFGGSAIVATVTTAMLNKEGIAISILPPELVLFKGSHPGKG